MSGQIQSHMSDIKPDPATLSSSSTKKRKTPSTTTTDLPSSPSKSVKKTEKTDPRHTFYGTTQKSGAWTQEEDKKLFQHMYPRAMGLDWQTVARDIEGRSLHSCQNRSNAMKKMVAEWMGDSSTRKGS